MPLRRLLLNYVWMELLLACFQHLIRGVEVRNEASEVFIRMLLRLAQEALQRRLLADEDAVLIQFLRRAIDGQRARDNIA